MVKTSKINKMGIEIIKIILFEKMHIKKIIKARQIFHR